MKRFILFITITSISFASLADKLLNYTFDDNFSAEKVANTYNKHRCAICHGEKGEKSSASFRALNTLSASELKAALVGYKTDRKFGKSSRAIMQRYAQSLSKTELDDIIYHIKGHELYQPNSPEIEPKSKTKHNLFIK